MGYSDPYPTPYPVIWPLLAIGAIMGSVPALGALVAAIAGSILYAAARIAKRFSLGILGGAAVGAFLLFNPWVYGKLVAGHLTMLIAYAGLALTVIELTEERPAFKRLSIALALSALQIQFFVIAVIAAGLRSRSRAVSIAIMVGLAVFSPTILGLVWHTGGLLDRLFTIEWENSQSVPLSEGVLLLGYFPHYAQAAFSIIPKVGIGIFGVLAVLGGCYQRARWSVAVLCGTVLLLILASGTTGVIGPAWRWAVLHAPAVGLYREMYDLIGAVAVGYTVLSAAAAQVPRVQTVLACGALLTLVAWFMAPPATHWVAASSVPRIPVAPNVERYALMPPFQPLTLGGKGDGIDPMYVGTSFSNAPLNAFLPEYPADAALARYWQTGNLSALQRLGVGAVVCRPMLQESPGARMFYGDARTRERCGRSKAIPVASPAPIVALVGSLPLCSLCNRAGGAQMYFGDAIRVPANAYAHVLPPLREHADPKRAWVDARLAFTQVPDLAEPFGGAYTEDASAFLALPRAPYALVNVQGILRDADGRVIASRTNGYRWVRLPAKEASVRCSGRCVIALTGNAVGIVLNAPEEPAVPLKHRVITPWMWTVSVPPSAGGVLHVLERYDAGWAALSGLRPLRHVRVSASTNGWEVSAMPAARVVILVHLPSLVQLLCEVLGYLALFAALRTTWQPD